MTAEIVVYNRNAIALAADSAVTVGRKTYNSANKLYMLSKYYPVGVLIYNSARINNIPVEIIVKEYRKRLGRRCFDSLKEYKEDFVKFLRSFIQEQENEMDKKNSILVQLQNMFYFVTSGPDVPQVQQGQDFFEEFNKHLDKVFDEISKIVPAEKNVDLTLVDIKTEMANIIRALMKIQDINEQTLDKLAKLFPYYINMQGNPNVTGIAICGYGEKEFMPKVYCFETLGFLNDCFKLTDTQTNENTVEGVIPLAQRDMADLFISGIDDGVYKFIVKQYEDFIDDLFSETNQADAAFARYVKIYKSKVSEKIQGILTEEKIQPLLNVIGILSKEELAELAESLVNLQALKHKMSLNIETVGGPIDVAIISKHDGFIWKKRKLYFDKDLNSHFFENYFSKDDNCDKIKTKGVDDDDLSGCKC